MLPLRHLARLLLRSWTRRRPESGLGDRCFESDGVRLRYVEAGTGEPVVLIHGFSATLESNWIANPLGEPRVLPHLARSFRVVALDLRGHGRSDRPHEPERYGRELSEDLRRLLDHLGIDRAHFVGYSLGSIVTARFLASHPGRVRSAILAGYGARLASDPEGSPLNEQLARSLEEGRGLAPLVTDLTPTGQASPGPAQARWLGRLLLGENDPLALAALTRAEAGLAVTEEEWRGVRTPLLLLAGARDPLLPKAEQSRLPHARFVVIEDGDHFSTLTRPEFREAVRRFLIEHAGSDG